MANFTSSVSSCLFSHTPCHTLQQPSKPCNPQQENDRLHLWPLPEPEEGDRLPLMRIRVLGLPQSIWKSPHPEWKLHEDRNLICPVQCFIPTSQHSAWYRWTLTDVCGMTEGKAVWSVVGSLPCSPGFHVPTPKHMYSLVNRLPFWPLGTSVPRMSQESSLKTTELTTVHLSWKGIYQNLVGD